MNRTSTSPRKLYWLFDAYHAIMGRGGQIDWTRVSSFFATGKFTVKLNGAAARGATSITVDAMERELLSGTSIDFGAVASVIVTAPAGALAAATSIVVSALSGPIPSGSVLDFTGTGEIARTTADVAAGATAIPVEALDAAIEAADTATFQGGRAEAILTEDASVGETALTVEPLQFPIADDAEAVADYTGTGDKRVIPSGTIMCRTADDKLIPRRDASAETATEILQSDAVEGSMVHAKSGYGTLIEAQVWENLLPDADPTTLDLPAGYKTELAASGARITYSDWSDSRFTD